MPNQFDIAKHKWSDNRISLDTISTIKEGEICLDLDFDTDYIYLNEQDAAAIANHFNLILETKAESPE